ncbi:MAG: diguanylate cyclase [Candidatus Thiodiazotropha taylori]
MKIYAREQRFLILTLLGSMLLWSLAVALFHSWHLQTNLDHIDQLLQLKVESDYQTAQVLQAWVSEHGEIYVPGLHHSKEPRDGHGNSLVQSSGPDGRPLIRHSAFSVLKDVANSLAASDSFQIRLIGRYPLNPENTADPWERQILGRLAGGVVEVAEEANFNGRPFYRLYRPIHSTPACLECHRFTGLEMGDMVGALGVNIALAPYHKMRTRTSHRLLLGHAGTWLLGCLAILLVARRWSKRLHQSKLHRSELERFRQQIDQAEDAIFVIDPKTSRFLDVNRTACDRLGYSQEELLQLGVVDIENRLPDVDTWRKHMMRFSETGHKSTRGEHLCKDGSTLPVEVNSHFIKAEDGHYVVASARDISERIELQQQLEYQATHDPLTGLYNRGMFEQEMQLVLARSRRHKRPLSLMMLDLDGFKSINDRYGHPVGDDVLRHSAKILMLQTREIDIIGRYGGEEFVIVLPETTPAQARELAERLRTAIAEERIPISSGKQIRITVSIGVAEYHSPEDSIEDLTRKADQALYQAKQNGRDRICLFEGE